MRVAVTELKARLSHYLKVAGQGNDITILDRGKPVAMLKAADLPADEVRARLIATGAIQPGTGISATLEMSPIDLGGGLIGALTDDRDDRF